MSHFVDVQIGARHSVTVNYEAKALLCDYQVHVAALAIEQEELRWMRQNLAVTVQAQIEQVFIQSIGPFDRLAEHSNSLRLSDDSPEICADGQISWVFDLLCPECDGDGLTITINGREVDCPCCATNGFTHSFSAFFDADGHFTGFPPRPVMTPMWASFSDYDFEPLPLDAAMAAAKEAA